MIISFKCSDTESLFKLQKHKLPTQIERVALRKLVILDAATDLNDLRLPPANRLEKLKGDRAGQHSIRINDQWRLCFIWSNGQAQEVEITDYH